MSAERNFYHIGYGKAGSSTLQCVFFPTHKEISFYGIQYFEDVTPYWPFEEAGRLCGQLVHPEYFDGFLPGDVAHINRQKALAAEHGKAFVYSNDHFSLLVAPQWSVAKMKELIPDAHIVVVLRRQQDIIKSIYKYRGKGLIYVPPRYHNGFVSFDEYFDLAHKNFLNRGGHKARDWVVDYFRIIDFNRLVNYYAEGFGEKNVHILFFEDLARAPREFYRNLTSILGVSFDPHATYVVDNKAINSSATPAEIQYERWKYALLGNFSFAKNLPMFGKISAAVRAKLRAKRGGGDIELNERQLEVFRSIYSEGNRQLAQRFGLDLASRGYLV